MTALQAERLRVVYDRAVVAVDIDSLEVEGGELFVVLGPNGSGKSSLLRALAGLVEVDGRVMIEGKALGEIDARERARRVAWLPQISQVPATLSVRELVELGRHPHRGALAALSAADHAAVDRALDDVGLQELRERRVATLSGGERRRALLARCLAQDGRVVLLDEPTAMLDLAHGMALFERVAALARERDKAVVLTTHDLNLASQFADRLLLLDRGRIAEAGTAERVLRFDVLRTVYGPDLECGELPAGAAGAPRPFVLSWRRGPPRAGG